MGAEPWNWAREDLDNLLGQAETLRLDFKQSLLLTKSHDEFADELSKTASAFANTEGGTIVIGIAERKEGKTRLADSLDAGTDIRVWSPERLQQIVASNLSPQLPAIRVKAVPLSVGSTTCAFVIHVPQGTTAYQARDRRYYSRSEYECEPLQDQVIRLLMFRGKLPSAIVKTGTWQTAYEELPVKSALQGGGYPGAITRELSLQDPDGRYAVRRYWCDVSIENTGEVNITELKVRLSVRPQGCSHLNDQSWSWKDGWPAPSYGPWSNVGNSVPRPMTVNIYPRDTHQVTGLELFMGADTTVYRLHPVLDWTLYLPNTLPTSGQIDLAQAFEADHIGPVPDGQ